MGESVKSGAARLEVSVSFGRFENDALSWEKWSSFSPNKYLEEVGNLSTPGSVAQKKAYFEAHYKKIAARKAEELEQEKSTDPVTPRPDISSKEDYAETTSEVDTKFGLSNGEKLVAVVQEYEAKFGLCNGEKLVEGVAEENEAGADEAKDDAARSSEGDDQSACTNASINAITSKEEKEDDAVAVECETSAIEEPKDELNGNLDEPELNVRKEAVLVGLETPRKGSQPVEKPSERKKGREQSSKVKKENSKLNSRPIAQKVTPARKERTLAGTKKNAVSPAAKPLQTSTPIYSKRASTSTPVSASQSLKKKVNGSPISKSKNSPVGESKRAAPTSLHMSLSLDPGKSCGALSMDRKSLIMEKMGDKDIVKRAFKTFQNRTSVSTTEEKPSPVKSVSSTASEPKISTSHTPRKGNEGLRKDAEKRATQRSQLGTRSNPLPTGSHTVSGLERKNTKAVSPTTGLRNDEKAEKRKEFLKKLEAKSIARETEKAQLSKSKVGVSTRSVNGLSLNR
ncbi:protein WVD2-like 7 [Sesamum indicum]|uniref:Protein WVD2-like 7 n=1 Tax=Sesamum indicum TaxID=4182 RepID=A0A6I9TS72_SESIN|nr:protein WVD2-like 7 [Sesamum indicum]XP_020551531.1 protein WVD2-like 7 [Sesamum indicum]